MFAVYLLDDKSETLHIAYAEGYPDEVVRTFRLKVGEGIVGTAVSEQRPILVNDVHDDARYRGPVAGVKGQLVVPLRNKNRVIGALNLLSDRAGAFTKRDEDILAQFGVHVAQAIVNARLFERERDHTALLETLTEIAREVAGILDLEELLSRIAILTKRVIDYRTFGILLVNEATNQLEPKVALQYGERTTMLTIDVGSGLVGYAAQHKEIVLVDDVSADPRYIAVVDDVRSELVIPLLLKDRCIGVFDLESPELAAFTPEHADMLRILASQAAVAIDNARLYETVRDAEHRLEREIEFASRVQMALLPAEVPRQHQGVEVAARFQPASHIGGDLYDFLTPDPNTLVVAAGDVSGKGVPAALYGAFVGELVRARTFRRRYTTVRSKSGRRAGGDEHDPARPSAGGILLHALLRRVRFQATAAHDRQLGPAVSDQVERRHRGRDRTAWRAARPGTDRRFTKSAPSTWFEGISTCSVRMVYPRRTTSRARNSALRASSRRSSGSMPNLPRRLSMASSRPSRRSGGTARRATT